MSYPVLRCTLWSSTYHILSSGVQCGALHVISCPQVYSVELFMLTHVLDELTDHAVPLALVVLGAVASVGDQPDLVGEAQDVGQLLQQVDAEALEAVVPHQRLVRLLKHDVWLLLPRRPQTGEPGQLPSSRRGNLIGAKRSER